MSDKPTVYLAETGDRVIVSSYPEDHKNADSYSLSVIGLPDSGAAFGGYRESASNTLTILRNILE
ncbi:MAG: hypothetical protein ABSA33_06920, partial [Candidatus Micrarchaeaceae archaeon]